MAALVSVTACNDNKQVMKPAYKQLTEAVYASGNLLPRNEYKVFALAEGYLTKRVEDGDSVSAGQVLFELESDVQRIRSQNAREQYRIAQANYVKDSPVLQELEAVLASAKAKLQIDSINYVRYKNLLENKATTRIDYDRASLSYETARNEYASLKNRYQKTRTQLLAELQNAEAQYKINAEQHANYTIKSRIDGMVYEIYKEAGEMVRPNEPIALLGNKNEVYLKLNVDELDINKIKVGQEVLVKIDTYPDQIFKAQVTKIYPMLNEREQIFRIDASFVEPPQNLYAGLTVEANIIINRKEQALTIPKSFVSANDSVKIEKDGKIHSVKIRKGIENMEFVEVLAGLDTNSILIE
jgi:multidrug efflux pump subunit AcrA (membrane-fusion protein)